jgi:hypothetical protein
MSKPTTNVALPKPRQSFQVLDSLQPGESLLFQLSAYDSLCTAITFRQRRDGTRFTRKMDCGGVRVWRVS